MPTFPKLQRNISYKTYIIDILISFILSLLSSSFIYFPLLIGLVITLNLRLSFVIPFLFFTELTHSFMFLSLIIFFILYKTYIYPILHILINKIYIEFFSIAFIYVLYFILLNSIYIINNQYFNPNYLFILYYVLVEQLLLILIKKKL